ncbi:MAG: substrate-binding domain-containing protein [Promethearchaeota archaeon]|jgi:tungstate transport system substrate-binding protein
MSSRKPFKEAILEHKTTLLIALIIIAGGSIGTFFALDYLNAQDPEKITLATTTSTYDSGLLDYLLPEFTKQTGIQVKVLSVGTGTAIQYGKDGNADIILVHSRSREDDFVNSSLGVEGLSYGIHRACVMFNDFILVGHISNPADLQPGDNITTVMTKLEDAINVGNMTFYSRGDNSGTHSKEKALWAEIGVAPDVLWTAQPDKYTETGQGMASTLLMTYEDDEVAHEGYTLVDRGTWLSFNGTYTSLVILAESAIGEDKLLNPYGVIPVNPVLHPHVKYLAASRFVGFLTSKYGQDLINSYKKNNAVLFQGSFGLCNNNYSCATTDNEIAYWTPFQAEFAGLSI